MKIYTEEEAKKQLNQLIDMGYTSFCPYCLSGLETTEDGKIYCPNEMCLNEEQQEISEMQK